MRNLPSFAICFAFGAVIASLAIAPSARADVRFSLFGDGDHSELLSGGSQTSGSLGIGGGLGIEIPVSSMAGIEVDGIYLPRKTQIDTTWIEIPVLFRVWFGDIFTVAAGVYYDQGIGSAKVNGFSQTFNAAGLNSSNLGAMGVVGFNVPVGDVSIFAEGRYGLGFYNVSVYKGVSSTFSDIQALVGLRIGSFSSSDY